MTKTHGHIGVFCLFPCHSLMCARAPQPSGWNLRHYLPPWALRLPVMIPGAIPGCSLNSPALMHGPVIWIKIHEEFLTKMIGRWSQTTVEAPRLFLAGNPAADVSDFFFWLGDRFWGTTSDVTLENKIWLSCLSQPAAFKVHILKEKKSGSDIAALNIEMHSNWD